MKALLLLLCAATSISAAKIVRVAGGGANTNTGPALEAKVESPFGVDFDPAGNMFIVEMTPGRVLKVDPQGILAVVAGSGQKAFSGDGGPARNAEFNGIHNLALGPDQALYLADTWNNRVRKIDRAGNVSTVAGTGEKGFSGDNGPAAEAKFGGIYCVSLDGRNEKLLLADLDNRRIRSVNLKTGVAITVAGNGKKGVPTDGALAVDSPLVDPRAVIGDDKGNVYILERSGNALRMVDAAGKIRTIVGTGERGASGDDGPAIKATLNGPKHLCFDHEGNIIIADTENHVVRKYLLREGKIVRIAGSGKKGTGGEGGSPLAAELNQPHGVYMHRSGELYISDSSNDRVLKIVPSLLQTEPRR